MSQIHFVRLTASVSIAIAILSWQVWASDSRGGRPGKILFRSDRSGSWQIYTMNPDGSDQTQVTNPAPNDDIWSAFPTISPDGQKIAFNYNAGSGFDLYVINIDAMDLRQLTSDHGSLFPRWSPDGKRGNQYLSGPHDFHPSWSPQGDASSSNVMLRTSPGQRSSYEVPWPRFRPGFGTPQFEAQKQIAASRKSELGPQTARRLKQIEEGGAWSQWGPAGK